MANAAPLFFLPYDFVRQSPLRHLGSNAEITSAGVFRVVTIKTRFDENTISAHRGNSLLYPNSRVVTVSDELGNEYSLRLCSCSQKVSEARHITELISETRIHS
jgi:hypothetical protein